LPAAACYDRGTLDTANPRPDAHGLVASIAYENGRRVGEIPLDDIDVALTVPGRFIWLGLYEPDAALLAKIQEEFGLHELAVEDARNAHQRPKVEQYGDSLFIVLRTISRDPQSRELVFGETHIFVGRNYVVTVRHGSARSHAPLRGRCEAQPRRLALGPGFAVYAIIDFIVDEYFPIVAEMEHEFEKLEELIFTRRSNHETTSAIYSLKRELIAVRHGLFPVIELCNRLMKFDLDLVPDEINPYLRDVHDHALNWNEMIDQLRDLLSSALDLNAAILSEEMTIQQRQLASWAAIIAVPTFIAGLYGMNFAHMPELGWKLGYPIALGVMGTICFGLYRGFKRSGWL
jgi:magnesium transporter